MYDKIVNAFFNELKNDKLIKLPESFYDDVRRYIWNKEYGSEREYRRIPYYIRELRKLRLYKAFYGSRENLLEEEREILEVIERFEDISPLKREEEEDKVEKSEIPKPINTQRHIDIVRVLTKFPEFTDGDRVYNLDKNDIVSLDRRISKILEKYKIVKRIKGESYENEKKDKEVLPLL
ncbi:MAG TPA: hypothetical protein EYH15_05820 [Methanothermococcus okinawensis]|uniref:Uncharacterized protein n=1 Tax=Methanothermococcus okinawensis TaxID=155863 RepID=A0A832ZK01_9EURY|nr:hypothetical protein [Methanothermococcus okinawensis]HIP91559.1 hypothetical protein [Methanothermococcus okinawensis]